MIAIIFLQVSFPVDLKAYLRIAEHSELHLKEGHSAKLRAELPHPCPDL